MPLSVEIRLDRLERDMRELLEMVNGGPSVTWERSLRGRLHAVTNTLDTANALTTALREVRRERARRWRPWMQFVLAACALLTAAAAVYSAVAASLG